jgi:hypothetical protein
MLFIGSPFGGIRVADVTRQVRRRRAIAQATSDQRAHEGAGHEAAEEGDGVQDGRLQAGGELTPEVAAEPRWIAAVRRRPEQLMADRQHHT